MIEKRDGRKVPFDRKKIEDAVLKATRAVDREDITISQEVTDEVLSYLNIFFKDEGIPTVEQIQDLVEKILIERGNAHVAKAYILYREQHAKLRDARKLFGDAMKVINSYLDRSNWKVNENSNMGFSLQGLNNHISSEITAQYWLQEIYPKNIRDLHINGDFHIHDLSLLSVYCCGWDLQDLLLTGFGGVATKTESKAPRHFRTALMQVVNFMYTLQGECAGAQAFSNFDTYLSPFIYYDNLTYKEVKQAVQEFVFNMNVPTRVGFQTPFSNITMDLNPSPALADQPAIIGGKQMDRTLGEFKKEMDMFNRAFAEVMLEGDAKGRVFSFPIPTYNITGDFQWDNEVLDPIWEMTAKYGIPYWSNFLNSDMNPDDVRSMCCRLRLSNRELRKRGGGLFGANPMTGSTGVVTLNMPRIGYLSQNDNDFIKRVYSLMDAARDSLELKRKILERFTDAGLYPYSRHYLRNVKKRFDKYWQNHFNTIGINGMNEALLNYMNKDIGSRDGREFAAKIMKLMRERMIKYQEETGNMYNLEATPAEGTSYRFARIDQQKFGNSIIFANHKRVLGEDAEPYYSNSSQLPVGYTDDIFTALELQDELQTLYTGGTVLHGFIGEKMPSIESTKTLIKRIAQNFRLPYYTITPTFSICPIHGYIPGEHEYCPLCDDEMAYAE